MLMKKCILFLKALKKGLSHKQKQTKYKTFLVFILFQQCIEIVWLPLNSAVLIKLAKYI